jgi:hypothetical protein
MNLIVLFCSIDLEAYTVTRSPSYKEENIQRIRQSLENDQKGQKKLVGVIYPLKTETMTLCNLQNLVHPKYFFPPLTSYCKLA